MPKELLTPDVLKNHIQAARAEIHAAYFEGKTDVVRTPFTGELTMNSLWDFTKHISGQYLNDFMRAFKKDGAEPACNFSLKPVFGRWCSRPVEEPGMGDFYLDANFGLALGTDSQVLPERKIWLGVTSFCFGREIEDYYPIKPNVLEDTMPFAYPFPVIVQIQGPPRSAYGFELRDELHKEALSVLEDYKWERALVGLVLEWARKEHISSVYLLPAEKNRWPNGREQAERFVMRYDVSAQRLGFRLQPNGLYATSVA